MPGDTGECSSSSSVRRTCRSSRPARSPFIGDYIDAAPAVPFVRNGNVELQHRADGSIRSSTRSGPTTATSGRRPTATGPLHRAESAVRPADVQRLRSDDQTAPAMRARPGRDEEPEHLHDAHHARLSSSARWAIRVRSPRRFSAASRCSRRTTANVTRTYRLTILDQPVGGDASFTQFQPSTSLDVSVPARSTIARTVFVRSSDPHAQVRVNVSQITEPNGTIVQGGQQGTIVLNPDPTNPDIANPDIANPDIANPDIANPDIANPTSPIQISPTPRSTTPTSPTPSTPQPGHRQSRHRQPGYRQPGYRQRHDSQSRHRQPGHRQP